MAKKLFSVRLSKDAKKIILDSLTELFDITYQKADSRRILDVVVEFSKVVNNAFRIYLTAGQWLIVLSALRQRFLDTPAYGNQQFARFQILGIAANICKVVEKFEGSTAYTFKQFRFFCSAI